MARDVTFTTDGMFSAIDADVVLLFAVESIVSGSFCYFHVRGMSQPICGIREANLRIRTPRGEVEECAGEHEREYCRSYESHKVKLSGPRNRI